MAMNIVRFDDAGTPRWGLVLGDRVQTLDLDAHSTASLMSDGLEIARSAAANPAPDRELAGLTLLCPITTDRQLIAQGLNYSSHLKEVGFSSGKLPFNTFFRKASSCLSAADTEIVRPLHVRLLDYEIELGLVLKRAITGPVKITRDNLNEYVGALVLHNDVSARDVQLPQVQFYKGKSYRTFGPTGPWLTLVDASDLSRLDEIDMRLEVNGELRQQTLAEDLSYKPAETLTELSEIQDLGPGDLVVTGTPGGTAVKAPGPIKMFIARLLPDSKRWPLFIKGALKDPDFLKDGDRIFAAAKTADGQIDLGEHHNTIVRQAN
jgi:2-keto-4-pentenoate hydratase/2-oxohepta-3-ene-1,7-dioic acid hydratase in catechol pathway